jgi:hypothetical protein
MYVVADTHVHLYPCYDVDKAFDSAFKNLRVLGTTGKGNVASRSCFMACFLTERRDCSFFRQMKNNSLRLTDGSLAIEPGHEDNVVLVRDTSGNILHLFAGRQIITSERLEVLSLTADLDIPDGLNIQDVISKVLECRGIPVLPWSPGKWFGRRGQIVEDMLHLFSPAQLLVGDTSLRPLGWPEPLLIRHALDHGFKVIAGSDPLPFAGEERLVGKYGVVCDADFDTRKPLCEVRRLLLAADVRFERTGHRCGPLSMFRRLLINSRVRRKYSK